MKRITSFLTTLVLLSALSIPAFAAPQHDHVGNFKQQRELLSEELEGPDGNFKQQRELVELEGPEREAASGWAWQPLR